MKERGFGRDPEPVTAKSHGFTRGATVTKLHRQVKAEEPDVDGLVTDFLHALDTYTTVAETPELVVSAATPIEIPAPEPPDGSLPAEPVPIPGPEVATPESKRLLADVDVELDQTLREIEAHSKSMVISGECQETARTPSPSIATFETARAEETPAQSVDRMEEVGIVDATTLNGNASVREARMRAEPVGQGEASFLPFLSAYLSQGSLARRRVAVGLTVLAMTAAICFAVYLAFLMRSALTGIGAGISPPSAGQTDIPAGSQPGAADHQVAPPEGLPPKAIAPAAGGAQHDPLGSPRAKAPAPAAQAPRPATRDLGDRAHVVPPPRAPVKTTVLESRAPSPAKETPLSRNEIQGSNSAVVIPLQTGPPSPVPASAKPAEQQQIMTQVQSLAPPVFITKADAEPPPAEASNVPPAVAPTAGGSAAMVDRTEAADSNIPAQPARTESVPLATPAEAIFKVAPIYPLAALKTGITGVVQVRVAIDERGKVTKATAISGQYVLRPAAEEALVKWKFKPATLRGENTKGELVVSVSFIR